MTVQAPTRNQSLDVLRCVAVLLVLGFHYPYYWLWSRLGWIGVDLFFVLSGFLISGILFQEYKATGSINFKRFLIRRGLKIYPSFYLLVVLALVLSQLQHSALLRKQALISAVFAQGYYSGKLYTVLSHTWSLAVEEHFYLLLPPLLLLLTRVCGRRDPFRYLPALFVLLFCACLAFRWLTLPASYAAHMTHMRMDSLFAGVLLGYLFHFRRTWFEKLATIYSLPLAFLFCLPAAFFDQYDRPMQTFGLTGLLVGFSLLVSWSVLWTPKSRVGQAIARFAARIGFYSYSIYLWHTILGETFFSSGVSLSRFWLYLVACVFAGVGMAHLIELPYLALRDRRFPVGLSAPSQTASTTALSEAPEPVFARTF
jgi:peptidoglycan/LPS O-acetylase OafA/YrhL